MSTQALSLEQCQDILQDIRDHRRRRLTGSEFRAIVEAVDAGRGDRAAGQLVRQVVKLLARHEGACTKPPFGDPDLNRTFDAARRPSSSISGVHAPRQPIATRAAVAGPQPPVDGELLQAQRERNQRNRAPRPA